MSQILYLVIPCYNEEDVLGITANAVKEKLTNLINEKKISEKSRIVFVNDGSTDQTWEMIEQFHASDKIFSGINLSRNRGHQNALLAGLLTVKNDCDFTISMDADLQDDINTIDAMVERYLQGYDIVYGVRNDRHTDSLFKRISAEAFYKFMNLLGANEVYNHADFRLMSHRALNGLAEFKEVNLFLRGLVPMIGFPATKVYYERHERAAGKSKYPLKKMIAFAFQGISSLSVEPIRLITMLGFLIFLVSILVFFYTLFRFFTGATITGWSSLMLSIWTLGGLILFSLGLVGEYIGKIYLEVKHRPRYIIEKFLNTKE